MNPSFSDSKMSGLGFRLCTNASNLLNFKELEVIYCNIERNNKKSFNKKKKFCKHSHQKLTIL